MKSRIMSSIAVVTLIMFFALMIVADTAYPMHIGEPTWYHVARVDCGMAAVICAFVSFVAALASAHF